MFSGIDREKGVMIRELGRFPSRVGRMTFRTDRRRILESCGMAIVAWRCGMCTG